MRKNLLQFTLIAAVGVLVSSSLAADLVYQDATIGATGNTTLSDGSPLVASDSSGGTTWRLRENSAFGSAGNVLEGVDPSPEIRTVLTGLVPGEYYDIYAHFWDPSSTVEDWTIRVGFDSNALSTFTREQGAVSGSLAGELASNLVYEIPPSLMGPVSNRYNLVAPMGPRQADVNGEISVYVDDYGSGSVNLRTWYDGLSYRVSDWDKDPDGDGYPNHLELSWGTDPNVAEDFTGMLSREVWTGITGAVLDDWLAERTPILSEANRVELTNGLLLPTNTEDDYAERIRGWVTAPVTGNYTFWISGDNECELWLSTSDSKFDRQLIASTPYLTAPQGWGEYPTQQSAPISLVAGERYFIECLHKENRFEDGLAVAWQVPGQALEIIPSTYLEPYAGESGDSDWDEMPDSWEMSNWGTLAQYAEGNPDSDLAPNWEEWLYGTDPTQVDSNVGYWSVERFYDMPYYSVPELTSDRDFYGEPTADYVYKKPAVFFGVPFAATRMRGYVQVEQSGNYIFWVTGRTSADLYLSDDETPYRKQRIAYLGSDGSTGHGIRSDSGNLWDVFSSQISQEIYLEAGEKYYLETIHQNGHGPAAHLQVAWAPSDGVRTLIPRRNMSFYPGLVGDADDDSLPDTWETQYGLDASDNGFGNLAKEGERGDFDGDGLNNREEYLHGSNPADADTDGDGLGDFAEVKTYGTNPSVSDVTPETLVSNVLPTSVSGLGDTWIETGDGVLTSSFRGMGTWNFTVPSDGIWIVQIEGKLRGDLRLEETLAVHASVDGGEIERGAMTFHSSNSGSLRVITPWLAAGSHEFGLFIDNYTARRSLEVTAVKIVAPGGLDTDGDGYSDPVEQYLSSRNHLLPYNVVETPISPVFMEGLARSLDHFELRTEHEGPGSTIRHKDSFWANKIPQIQSSRASLMNSLLANPSGDRSAAGSLQPGIHGPGYSKWFAEILLNANQATGYSVFFENGALGGSGVVVWRPINLFNATQITIPAGRNLLMGAWDKESDNSDLTFTIDGQVQPTFKAKDALAWNFPNAGSYAVSVFHQKSGQTLNLNVDVRDADLQPDIALGEQRLRSVNLPGVGSDLALDSGNEISLDDLYALNSGGSQTTMGGIFPGVHRTAARLSETEAILDQEVVHVVGVSDGLRNASDIATPQGDGMFLVRSPLLVTHLPTDGAYLEVTIFAGGVTFPDGTTERTLNNSDLDDNGVVTLELLMPAERLGAPCHYINVYDKNAVRIWNSNN